MRGQILGKDFVQYIRNWAKIEEQSHSSRTYLDPNSRLWKKQFSCLRWLRKKE